MTKKYYWLKLKEDFFRQKEIKKLRKIAGGDTYTIIYLKMQLLSIKSGGALYFEGVEQDFASELALELDEDEENVQVTLNFLMRMGLLSECDDEYTLPYVKDCIGKESASTERVRKHRSKKALEQSKTKQMLQCNTSVTKCNTEIEIEQQQEIETEQEIEQQQEIEKIKKVVGVNEDDAKKILDTANGDIVVVVDKWNIIKNCNLRNKTGALIKAIQENWKVTSNTKQGTFNNFDQREYDYDDLENKLLGL